MKNDERDPKFEKYFNFFKMDKKNVQNWIAKNTLTEKKNRLDSKKLWSYFTPYFFYFMMIFFSKNLKIFSQ